MNNTLPPVNSLPHWSRINVLDKVFFPKQFSKDPKVIMEVEVKNNYTTDESPYGIEINTSQRIQYLERNIAFLQQEHADVLRSLQDEVDNLKKENKELQFKIVMSQKVQIPKVPKEEADITIHESVKTEEMRILFLEEEVKELKHALRETRNKNHYLTQLLEQKEKQSENQKVKFESSKRQINFVKSDEITEFPALTEPDNQPMSLTQCYALIKHLKQVNDKQSHELNQLKLDLRDVLYSHKWTPDAFLMAKAYVAEDERKEEGAYLPKIPMKHPTKKIPDMAYLKENLSLPALHLTVGNKAVERKKRTQVIQKSKLRSSVLP
ncbi:hypothetical protein Btru_032085 [Bulinus truncatus]|nr:hypothetical protein Btru_032085 [Bulinus truncatus]